MGPRWSLVWDLSFRMTLASFDDWFKSFYHPFNISHTPSPPLISNSPINNTPSSLPLQRLESEECSVRTTVAKGLCKLLQASRITSPALVSQLTVLWYNPLTGACCGIEQLSCVAINKHMYFYYKKSLIYDGYL